MSGKDNKPVNTRFRHVYFFRQVNSIPLFHRYSYKNSTSKAFRVSPYHNIRRNSHSAVWTDAIRQFGRIPFGSLDDQISPSLFHRPRGNSCFAWSPTCSSCLLSLRGVSESRSMVKRASCSFPLPNECTSPIPHLDSKTPELPAAKAKPSFNGWIRRNPRKTRISRGLSPSLH